MTSTLQTLDQGIHLIDTGFHRPAFDASYLLVEGGRAAFVDTGVNAAVPRLMAALAQLGLAPEAVDFVVVTHVHLDHAGAVGTLLPLLPNARVVAHPRAAPHLIQPRLLVQGASAVYGREAFERLYGTIVPVPEARIHITQDGETLPLAGRPLQFLHTPGHARHHHVVWDARSGTLFTGDTFGLSYREFDTAQGSWLLPTASPVEFDADALRDSVRRMLALGPQALCVTHYGRVTQVPRLGTEFLAQIDEVVALALPLRHHPQRHDALKAALTAHYAQQLEQRGIGVDAARMREVLELDIELNAQGLAIWLDRADRPPRPARRNAQG